MEVKCTAIPFPFLDTVLHLYFSFSEMRLNHKVQPAMLYVL